MSNKKLIVILIVGVILAISGRGLAKVNYDLIYKDTPILDYMYESGVDPDEKKDYESYTISPYTLVRLPLKLRNKNVVLNPGYYLVKPEKRNGYEFVIFKQNGSVAGIVPIYQKLLTNPAEIFPEPPKPKIKWYKKPYHWIKSAVAWPFKKLRNSTPPPLPPKAKIEYEFIKKENYYIMRLYRGKYLYKMLFRIEPI